MADLIPKDVTSIAPEVIAVAALCSSFSMIFVALRIYTRVRIIRSIGWDDYLALITLPFSIAHGVVLGISTRYGTGLHSWDLPMDLEDEVQMWTFISAILYILCVLGYKMSILFFYLRIFNIDKVFRYCTWSLMFITSGYLFSNLWTLLFICQPIDKSWRPETPGHCDLTVKAVYGFGSLHFITDLLIFVLPLPIVWRMQLSLKEKVGLSMIFMLGSLNWMTVVIRFVYLVQTFKSNDPAWLASQGWIWAIVEINTGLICACIPTLKPFFREVVAKLLVRKLRLSKKKISESENALGDGKT